MNDSKSTIAVIGGTGALGSGLAMHWAAAGFPVIIGSRSAERAAAGASEIAGNVRGMANLAAAEAADMVVVTVPFASHEAILGDIRDGVAGKIVVDATVPLRPPKVGTVQLPPEGSAAQRTQAMLGDRTQVVAAFHNVAAHKLQAGDKIDCDVLVCGDKRDARQTVIGLAEAIGLRGYHAGPLANAAAAEAMTSVLISINRHHKIDGAGIRITGA